MVPSIVFIVVRDGVTLVRRVRQEAHGERFQLIRPPFHTYVGASYCEWTR